jgi:HAD superfamily hydrolase (TIGR01509 family)
MSRIEWVLFDLGNVLVEVEQSRIFDELGRRVGRNPAEVKETLLSDKPFWDRFIIEECSPVELTQQVNLLLKADLEHQHVIDAFNSELGSIIDSTAELIPTLRRSVKVGCLSNTNSIHWNHMLRSFEFMQQFDRRFASQIVGYAKPDPEIYKAAAGQLGVRPDQILFFDDKPENISAAERLGWNARVYRNHSDLSGDLREFQLL